MAAAPSCQASLLSTLKKTWAAMKSSALILSPLALVNLALAGLGWL